MGPIMNSTMRLMAESRRASLMQSPQHSTMSPLELRKIQSRPQGEPVIEEESKQEDNSKDLKLGTINEFIDKRNRKHSIFDMTEAVKLMRELGSTKKLNYQHMRQSFNGTSSQDSSDEEPDLSNIIKILIESWEDVTEVSMPSMIVIVPSDLKDNTARCMNIEAGLMFKMESDQTAHESYDIQNELYPIKVHTEVLNSNMHRETKLTKLSLYLSESKIDFDGTEFAG